MAVEKKCVTRIFQFNWLKKNTTIFAETGKGREFFRLVRIQILNLERHCK